IGVRSHDFYNALLGVGGSAWALQSAVAVLALLAVVLAVRPDLLERLQSFKAGELEARFSDVSGATREAAHFGVSDISREVSIKQWIYFEESFMKGSARQKALILDKSDVKTPRLSIRNEMFPKYIV